VPFPVPVVVGPLGCVVVVVVTAAVVVVVGFEEWALKRCTSNPTISTTPTAVRIFRCVVFMISPAAGRI
jgi:hypothetical protein